MHIHIHVLNTSRSCRQTRMTSLSLLLSLYLIFFLHLLTDSPLVHSRPLSRSLSLSRPRSLQSFIFDSHVGVYVCGDVFSHFRTIFQLFDSFNCSWCLIFTVLVHIFLSEVVFFVFLSFCLCGSVFQSDSHPVRRDTPYPSTSCL